MKKRLFIALDILETDKVKIAQWRDQNLSLQFNAICAQNFHITLAFIGFIDQQRQEQLIALINEQHEVIQQHVAQQSLTLTLTRIGYFKTAQVLHLMPTTSPDWLLYLNKLMVKLCQHSDITLANQTYLPHLSLYRKAKFPITSTLAALQDIVLEQQLSIKSFSLYHSYSTTLGVRYEPIQTWKLNF